MTEVKKATNVELVVKNDRTNCLIIHENCFDCTCQGCHDSD